MVYLSSLEVYGSPDEKVNYITEKDYGYLDPMQVRSSYSEGKRMAECLCAAYAKEYNVPVSVARLSQTFGAGVSYDDGQSVCRICEMCNRKERYSFAYIRKERLEVIVIQKMQ